MPRIGQQLEQDVEFPGSDGDFLAVPVGGDAVCVQRKVAHRQPAALLDVGAAQQRPHPHEQFTQVHRLDHVIIDAQIKALLLGGQVVPRRHEQNGDGLVQPPHRAGKRKTVGAGHHDVRNDEVVNVAVHGLVGGLGGQHALGLVAAVVQVGTDALGQLPVVVHHENMNHSCSPLLKPDGHNPHFQPVIINCSFHGNRLLFY